MKSLKPLKFALELWGDDLSEIEKQDPDNYDMFGEIAVMLADFMRNDYQIVVSYELRKLLENGSWSGLMGVINRSEADISLNNFFLTPETSEGAAFLYPIEIGEVTFGTKRLTPTPNPTAVFRPFSTFVWFSLAVSILSMILAYLYFFKNLTFLDSVFSVLAGAFRQPPSLYPKTSSERIVMGSWLFGMAIITACYMSLLLSYLTFPNLRRIKNVLELSNAVEKGDYHCFTEEIDSYKDDFLNSSIKALRTIGKNLMEAPLYKFRQSSVTNAAYITFRPNFKLFAQDLFISEDSFFMRMFAYATRKDFCCKDKLNWAILRLIETGIYDRMLYYYYFEPPEFEEVQLTRNLTLSDFTSIFIMFLVGCGVSCLTLLLEILTYKLNSLKTRRSRNC